MNFISLVFYFLSILIILSSLRVINSKDSVSSILYLIIVFFNTSMIWILIGAEFLSLILVAVYVGALMVLFLFIIMMLDIKYKSKKEMNFYIPKSLIILFVMIIEMTLVLNNIIFKKEFIISSQFISYNNTRSLGIIMYNKYYFAVELGALILLVSMISTISLSLNKKLNINKNYFFKNIDLQSTGRFNLVKIPKKTKK